MTEGLPKPVPGAVRAEESRERAAAPKIRVVIGNVHRALRAATRNDHALIDRMLLPFHLSTPDDYRAFLNIHFAALLTLRERWQPEDCGDFEQMLRCLEADLGSLGTPVMAPPILPGEPVSPCRGLGIAYVIRGSRLGAAALRRGVGRTLPTMYLDCMPALSWTKFLGQLESIAEDREGIEEAIRAARGTFDVFAAEINRVNRTVATLSA
jgi:heme oxygenase